MLTFLSLALAAYLLGSVPTGLVVARLLGGPDPRQAGSGNVGAANLYRLLGRNAGILTLLGDALKGALPVFLALSWLAPLGAWHDAAVAVVGLAAVLGHIWPVFLLFQGGKAVATAFGVVAVLCPLSYILVLTAMQFTLVSYVAPAREVSILIAAFLGARWLSEGDARRRGIAAALMTVGIVALAMG